MQQIFDWKTSSLFHFCELPDWNRNAKVSVPSLQRGRVSWSDKGQLVWWHQRIMAILTVVNIPKQEVLALRESNCMETDVRWTFPPTHRKQCRLFFFFFSVHGRFWWGVGDLTAPSNSVFTTRQTHIWNSFPTLIANSQLISCTHREPQSRKMIKISRHWTTYVDKTMQQKPETKLFGFEEKFRRT